MAAKVKALTNEEMEEALDKQAKKPKSMTNEEMEEAIAKQNKVEDEEPKAEPLQIRDAPESTEEMLRTAAEQAGQALTLGYVPQIMAGAQSLVSDRPYTEIRDELVGEMEQREQKYPLASKVGTGAGILGSLAIPSATAVKAAKGLPLAQKALLAGIEGMAQYLGYNPGETPGEVSPLQIEERLAKADESPIATTMSGILPMLGPAMGKMMPKTVGEFPERMAESATGLSGSERKMALKSEVAGREAGPIDIGKFALKEKIVQAGDDFSDIYEKANRKVKDVGRKIGDLNERVLNEMEIILSGGKISPEEIQQFFTKTISKDNLSQIREKILAQMPDTLGAQSAVNNLISQMSDDLFSKTGSALDVKRLQNLRSSLGQRIRWAKTGELPANQEALLGLRNVVDDAINNEIDFLVKHSVGNSQLKKDLTALRKEYNLAKSIEDSALKKAARSPGAKGIREIVGDITKINRPTIAAGSEMILRQPESRLSMAIPKSLARMQSPTRFYEGYPELQTVTINPGSEMMHESNINTSDLSPSEKANQLNLLRKHGRIILPQ